MGVFHVFKLYKWCQIAPRITYVKTGWPALLFSRFVCNSIVGRGVLTPLYYPAFFFKFCPTPLPVFVNSHLDHCCSFCCLVSLTKWVIAPYLLFCSMILWIYTSNLGTSLPEVPWCVFWSTRRQVYWGLTRDFLVVLWFDITLTQTHSTLRGQ